MHQGCEIIIVDDGSNDGSEIILKYFAEEFPQIKLIVTSNFGSANARNTALNLATRNFVFFLDIDDTFNFDVLQLMYESLRNSNYCACIANYSVNNFLNPIKSNIFTNSTRSLHFRDNRDDLFNAKGFWRILYRREYLIENNITFHPTFDELGGKFFILDDVFWLLFFYASDGEILVLDFNSVVYQYNLQTISTRASRKKYTKQILLIQKAINVVYFEYGIINPNLDLDWIRYKCFEILDSHLKYLKLLNFLKIFPQIVIFIYKIRLINMNSLHNLLITLRVCTYNSLYPIRFLFRLLLIKIGFFLKPIRWF